MPTLFQRHKFEEDYSYQNSWYRGVVGTGHLHVFMDFFFFSWFRKSRVGKSQLLGLEIICTTNDHLYQKQWRPSIFATNRLHSGIFRLSIHLSSLKMLIFIVLLPRFLDSLDFAAIRMVLMMLFIFSSMRIIVQRANGRPRGSDAYKYPSNDHYRDSRSRSRSRGGGGRRSRSRSRDRRRSRSRSPRRSRRSRRSSSRWVFSTILLYNSITGQNKNFVKPAP